MEKIINIFLRISEIVILFITILLIAFQDFLPNILSIKTDDVLIILISVIIMQILGNYINNRDILRKITTCIKVIDNNSEAYNILLSKKIFDIVRIYALGSNVIQPHFDDIKGLHIKRCILLIKEINKENEFSLEIESIIKRWKSMVDTGRIEILEIYFYSNVINNYYILVDDKIMMTDVFIYDENDTSGQTTSHSPILYFDNSDEGKEVIKRCINLIENNIDFAKKRTDNMIYKKK